MKHNTLIGRSGILCLSVLLGSFACRKMDPKAGAVVSIHFPDEFLSPSLGGASLDLGKIVVTPRRGKFSSEELLELNVILQQLVANAQADGKNDLYLSGDTDLYLSLHASLELEPGWHILQIQMHNQGKLNLYSIAAFIEATQRPKVKK